MLICERWPTPWWTRCAKGFRRADGALIAPGAREAVARGFGEAYI